jgi:hypothetical protein
MDAPLAAPNAFIHSDCQQDAEPQPLPQELRDDIRRALAIYRRLGGKWGPSALATLWHWLAGFCGYRALTAVGADSAAKVMAAALLGVGLLVFAITDRVTAIVAPHVLSQLDEATVSAKGTAALSKTMKRIKGLLGYTVLAAGAFAVALAIASEPDASYQSVAAVMLVAATPLACVLAASNPLAPDLTYQLAADAAEQVAADAQRATAATADYNGLAKRIHRVHMDTVELSERMTPSILLWTSYEFIATLAMLYMAVGPRPASKGEDWLGMGNWYNLFYNQYFCACMATNAAAQLVWGLSGPAKVTSACQRIASAVNDLRLNAGAGDGTVTLATSEQLHRIEGLKRYINEQNRDQGLGFLLLRKRITFTFVLGLLIQTVGAMPVVITLMSIATGQHEVSHQDLQRYLADINGTLGASGYCKCSGP